MRITDQLNNGCNWQDLPKDLLPDSTVYWHVLAVAASRATLETNERPTWAGARTGEKKAKGTTLIIIDVTSREKYL